MRRFKRAPAGGTLYLLLADAFEDDLSVAVAWRGCHDYNNINGNGRAVACADDTIGRKSSQSQHRPELAQSPGQRARGGYLYESFSDEVSTNMIAKILQELCKVGRSHNPWVRPLIPP